MAFSIAMGILNRMFSSVSSITEHAQVDDETITKSWEDYLKTVPEKTQIAQRLLFAFGERIAILRKLEQLLRLELVDITTAESADNDLILNLKSLEHAQKIKRINRISDCLGYAETKYQYVYELLRHLCVILRLELELSKELQVADIKKYRKLIDNLNSELAVELTIITDLKKRRTFHNILVDLVKGEKLIEKLDATERQLLREVRIEMKKIVSGKLKQGVIFNLARGVLRAIEYKIHNSIGNAPDHDPGGVSTYHPDVDFEYVNRDEFVTLVKQMIKIQRISDAMSEQMIRVFVHAFREWYNHERK